LLTRERAPPAALRAVTVVRGDTLYGLARTEGTTVNALMEANGVTDPTRIYAGQQLLIPEAAPPPRGTAKGGRADPRPMAGQAGAALMVWIGDRLAEEGTWGALAAPWAYPWARDRAREGQPQARGAHTEETGVHDLGTGGPGALYSIIGATLTAPSLWRGAPRRFAALPVPPRPSPAPKRPVFCHPVADATITSYFGFDPWRGSFHGGVDFAQVLGAPIVAAGAGVVTLSGPCGAYGNCVVIDHGGGHETLYGHAERLHVVPGQQVAQGQEIAAVGSTGRSTGPHLHFEVRHHNRCVEPLEYLSVLTADTPPARRTRGRVLGAGKAAAAAALRGGRSAASWRLPRPPNLRDGSPRRVAQSAAHLIALGR